MRIVKTSLLSGARAAKGVAVIIDVFRAATTSAFLMGNGAERVILAGSLSEAWSIKEKNPDFILMGERGGFKVDGFDYGNSPHLIKDISFSGKNIILTTSSGTRGLAAATDADCLFFAGFVNASATARCLESMSPGQVSLVSMGWCGEYVQDEDELCAGYLADLLEGRDPDFEPMRDYLRNYESAEKFFNPRMPEFPEGDFCCAMDLDRFDFPMQVNKGSFGLEIKK